MSIINQPQRLIIGALAKANPQLLPLRHIFSLYLKKLKHCCIYAAGLTGLLSLACHAEPLAATNVPAFYLQPHNQDALLLQVMPHQRLSDSLVARPEHKDDLAFNYLWLQQHRADYDYSDGGKAAGKVLRMGLKVLYHSYYGHSNRPNALSNDAFSTAVSNIDYRLRISSDRVKLGVKYEF